MPTAIYGSGTALALYPQENWGEKADTGTIDPRPLKIQRTALQSKPDRIRRQHRALGGNGVGTTRSGLVRCGGATRFPVTYAGLGVLWQALMGSAEDNIDSAASAPYRHRYILQKQQTFLTIVQQMGDALQQHFQGMKPARLVLEVQAGQELMLEVQWVGELGGAHLDSSHADWVAITHTTYTFIEHDDIEALTWNSKEVCPTRLRVVLDLRNEAHFCVGASTSMEPRFSGAARTIAIEADIDFDDQGFYADFIAETTGDWAVNFANGDERLELALDDCLLLDHDPDISTDGVIKLKLRWEAQALTTADAGLTVIAQNSQATATEA